MLRTLGKGSALTDNDFITAALASIHSEFLVDLATLWHMLTSGPRRCEGAQSREIDLGIGWPRDETQITCMGSTNSCNVDFSTIPPSPAAQAAGIFFTRTFNAENYGLE